MVDGCIEELYISNKGREVQLGRLAGFMLLERSSRAVTLTTGPVRNDEALPALILEFSYANLDLLKVLKEIRGSLVVNVGVMNLEIDVIDTKVEPGETTLMCMHYRGKPAIRPNTEPSMIKSRN